MTHLRRETKAKTDFFVLEDMKAALARHLNAALLECSAIANDLSVVDADQIMTDLRAEFDPYNETAPIQDCFTDGFYAHECNVIDVGGEPITNHGKLPSGVYKPVVAE